MAKYKFFTSVCDYGTIEVEADNYEDAVCKAYRLNGTYNVHETEVLDISEDYGYDKD